MLIKDYAYSTIMHACTGTYTLNCENQNHLRHLLHAVLLIITTVGVSRVAFFPAGALKHPHRHKEDQKPQRHMTLY